MADISKWSTEHIKNVIWGSVANGQPTPGQVSIDELRDELVRRGEEPKGFHNS